MTKQNFKIRNNHLYFGGTYCTSLKAQSDLLSKLCKQSDIKSCIQKYTDDSYYNFYLRGSEELKPENFEQASVVLQSIFSMFEKIEPYTPKGFIFLYRGVDVEFDQAINDCGFMSFSADREIAEAFGKNLIRIILHEPFQYKLLPLEKITTSPKEYEVLLAPGRGQFYIHSEQPEKKMKTYIYVPIDAQHSYELQNQAHNRQVFCSLKLKQEQSSFFKCFSSSFNK